MNHGVAARFFRTLSMLCYVICLLLISGSVLTNILRQWRDHPPALSLPPERLLLTINGVAIAKVLHFSALEESVSLQADEPDVADVDIALPLICRELESYPSSLIAKSNISTIKLCKNLKLNGVPSAALAHFSDLSVFVDVTQSLGRGDCLIRTLHHEIFHILDKKLSLEKTEEVNWESLNGKGFTYGPAPSSMLSNPSVAVPDESVAGFLNKYSTSEPGEDRAEVFSFMMTRPDYIKLRLSIDVIIRMKVKRIAEMLVRLCPEMGPEFWKTRGLQVAGE